MENIPKSLSEKYEYDREHNWMKWLEINAEIADKYCYRFYLSCSYENLRLNLEYPKEEDMQTFQAAHYNKSGFTPILLRGVVIENRLDKNGNRFLQLISPEKVSRVNAETILYLRNTASVQNTLLLWELYSNRSEYSIGDIHEIRPGTKVIVAATSLMTTTRNKNWLAARYTDIAPDLDSNFVFVDDTYRIHQSEKEYLMRYEQLASVKQTGKHNKYSFKKDLSEDKMQTSKAKKGGFIKRVIKWALIILFAGYLLSECAGKTRTLESSPPQESQTSLLQEIPPTDSTIAETKMITQPTTEETVVQTTTHTIESTEGTLRTEQTHPITEETIPTTLTGSVRLSVDALNIRSGAGTNYSIVGRLMGGDAVTIHEQKNINGVTWGNIGYGWVSMQYIELYNGNSTSPINTQSPPTSSRKSEYFGEWVSNDGYWHMSISQNGKGAKITAEHFLSDTDKSTWEMYGEYDEHSAIRYCGGTRMDHDVHSGNIRYTSGEGAIVLSGSQLSWHESMEGPGEIMAFSKANGQYTPKYEQNAVNTDSNLNSNQNQNAPAQSNPYLPAYNNTSYQNIADMSCDDLNMRPQYALDFFNNNSDSIFSAIRRIVFSKAKNEISSEISEADDREASIIITDIQRTTSRTDAIIVYAEGTFEGHPYWTEVEIYWWWENASIASNCLTFGWV